MGLLKLLKHKIRLAQGLSLRDWLTLIEAWWRLLFFHLALRVTSYDRLDDSTRAADSSARRESGAQISAQKIRLLVGYAARLHLIPMTCLHRSLALQKILSERNIPAQIRIGAQKKQGSMYAHAWVEVDKKPVGEADDIAEKFNILTAVQLNSRQFI
jgi:hypothetical protein